MTATQVEYGIRRMTVDDLPGVVEIDRQSFPIPWPERTYRYELKENSSAHLFVASDSGGASSEVIGYVGYWMLVDEAHISTIAVHPDYRRRGLGEQLLLAALRHALKLGAVEATLEVRASNLAAQNLYRKYGFEEVGQRQHYYRDNGEDAILMTARPLRLKDC